MRFAQSACVAVLIGAAMNLACLAAPAEKSSKRHGAGVPNAGITTSTLLEDMIDLRRLSELPQPAYTERQASSYDRASKTPDDKETWFANGDAGQYIREETNAGRHEFVMMDANGPGAIVRIWSANPDGTLRIYLDGDEKPAIEAPMKDLLGGKFPGLPRPIAGEYSRGWNLYFPIPYAAHAKVTSDKGRFYYHVNYRTYEKSTKVNTFKLSDIERLSASIDRIAKALDNPRVGSAPPADRDRKRFEETLSPGKEIDLAKLEGPKVICGLLFRIIASDLPAAARNTVLKMSFDGEKTVECPLGDFVGSALLAPFDSLPMGVTEAKPQELWCHWWMPFKKSARISLITFGKQTIALSGGYSTMPYTWTDRSLLFHAKWRIERDIPSRPIIDWTHLDTTGEGRFVGGALHIINTDRGWWGEGDEKMYVDGEKFPSTFGTGSEDYYGYAWGSPERFVHAYHNQPYSQGPGSYGNTLLNRFHILDDIPFTTSFKFDMENWHGHPGPRTTTTRAAVTYWYARPGGKDFFKPITREDVQVIEVPPFKPTAVAGAIEGENMKVLEKTATVEPQSLGEPYSHDSHLWWRDGKPGDKLVLEFKARRGGKHHVLMRVVKAADYGQMKFWINDQPVSNKPFDLDGYNAGVMPSGEIDLGEFEIKNGPNKLTVQIVGANPAAEKRYMFGLDYLRVN